MPRKIKTAAADQAALPQIPAELLERLIPGPVTPGQLEDIFQKFKKAFIQQALGAEMSHHLGYAPGQAKPEGAVNHRNGKSAKTVLTDTGALAIEVPRDRAGSFEPQLIGKHERRFSGFDDKIIAMYARGMTVREIQGYLAEMYAVDVSPELISKVTDAVMSEAALALAIRGATVHCTGHKFAACAALTSPPPETVMPKIPAINPLLQAWLVKARCLPKFRLTSSACGAAGTRPTPRVVA